MPAEIPTPEELAVRDPKGEINRSGYYFEDPETAKEAVAKYVHTEGENVGKNRYDTTESKSETDNLAAYEYVYRAAIKRAKETGVPVVASDTPEYTQLTQEQRENCGMLGLVVQPDHGEFDEWDESTNRLKGDIFSREKRQLVDHSGHQYNQMDQRDVARVNVRNAYEAVKEVQAENNEQDAA